MHSREMKIIALEIYGKTNKYAQYTIVFMNLQHTSSRLVHLFRCFAYVAMNMYSETVQEISLSNQHIGHAGIFKT